MIFAVYADDRYEGAWRAFDAAEAIRRAKLARAHAQRPSASTWRAEALAMYRGPRARPGEPDDVAEARLDLARENPEEGENE